MHSPGYCDPPSCPMSVLFTLQPEFFLGLEHTIHKSVCDQKICPKVVKSAPEWLIEGHIDGLAEGGTSCSDMLDLISQHLNSAHDSWHHVTVVRVKEVMSVI